MQRLFEGSVYFTQAWSLCCVFIRGNKVYMYTPIMREVCYLLRSECRSFVLKLWKFLHVAALQRQHTILDAVVEDLAPLPSAAVSFLEKEEGDVVGGRVTEPDSFADKIQVCRGRD